MGAGLKKMVGGWPHKQEGDERLRNPSLIIMRSNIYMHPPKLYKYAPHHKILQFQKTPEASNSCFDVA